MQALKWPEELVHVLGIESDAVVVDVAAYLGRRIFTASSGPHEQLTVIYRRTPIEALGQIATKVLRSTQ